MANNPFVILFWRHIFMVLSKYLILYQIIVTCGKELGFPIIWSQGVLSGVFSPLNKCSRNRKEWIFFISSYRLTKNGFITATQFRGNCHFNWCDLSGHNTSNGTKKWFYSITTLDGTLLKPILGRLIITCSVQWHIVWLISSSPHIKSWKNSWIRWQPQKMDTFIVAAFELCQKNAKR